MTLESASGSEFAGRQPHIQCEPGDVARYVFLPGDPARAAKIAAAFDRAEKVAEHREYVIFTGESMGVRMSVCSTGIGSPSAAIAIEELGRIGADTFIRVGSAGGLQDGVNSGDIAIATAAYRGEGTSLRYLPAEFPAVADWQVTTALLRAAAEQDIRVHAGLCSSGDAFYATKPAGFTEMLHDAGVIAGEMECAALFIIGAVRGWRVGGILAIDGNIWKRLRKTPGTEAQFREAEQREIAIAIRAAVLLAAEDAGPPR